jgi:exodeoxyribonuclease V gamma subunit
MTKDFIVLQSLGMMQWLSIRLADKLGIWADFEYVLPNRMTGILMKSFFPGLGDERFFDKDIMTWKTMKILRQGAKNPVYSELNEYMSNDSSGIKEYQVSARITDLFDQYMTFRPDMITRWDRGEFEGGEEWQPHLWRELTAGMNGDHPPSLLEKLFRGIDEGSVKSPEDLPRRISVFGVSYLPLYHLNVLRAASNFCDVYLYMLNPCMEYWVDIMREKEISSLVLKKQIIASDFEEELHIERGNPILSSMGRAGRDFFRFLYMSDIETGDEQFFDEPEGGSLLSIIQRDILTMTERGERKEAEPVIISDDAALSDCSIVINSCHSIMREIEVLHDYLLDLFNTRRDITPGDVLVMTPDIESCSSIIQGVFDRREEGLPRIPYRIVDRNIGNTSSNVNALMKILALPEGRFASSEIMGILQCPGILKKFDLNDDDFDRIGSWVRETGIFWGIDSGYKERLGLPEIHENTWSFGLERMLLGSVMMSDNDTVLDVLPYLLIEGNSMQVLGRFVTFFRLLCDIYYTLLQKHTPAEWGSIINRITENFFETESETPEDMLEVTGAAARLMEIEDESGFSGKTGLLPVKEFIEKSLSAASGGRNFITGNLTFCEMLPMRSIPCRVICLIGMNEYSFPRKARPSGFDLMMKKPRMGDRSVRDEDRYLFLETIISARERLYISYTGQNITTNTDQNPSIVVSELMDCIEQSFITESGRA